MLLHIRSREEYPIAFLPLHPHDMNQLQDWNEAFDWSIYFGKARVEVYKMVLRGNDVIQGVIALERKEDHIWVHLIESIPEQRKEFKRIGLHLLALACKRSIELGFEGAVALQSKTSPKLMQYYSRVIGATHIGGGLFIIDETVAERLIMLYLS